MVWLKFVICILVIFFSGQRVAKYGDIIADRTGLGRVWIGVVAVALITSLPELFTGISAVTLVNAPDLTIGDLLGANAFNMFNLALLDFVHRGGPLLANASQTHRLTGWFSLLLVAAVGLSILVSTQWSSMALGWVGWYTPFIIVVYLVAMRQIYRHEQQQPSLQEEVIYHVGLSSTRVYLYFAIAAVFIIGAGIWLATIGDEIARATGWGQGFVGSLFLAFSTTLPEMTVSFAAMRMGSVDLAVANMIGSNLFNLTIIPVIDIIYARRPILSGVAESHMVTAAAVVVMTLIFIVGLRFPPRRLLRLSWWNISLVLIFLASAYFSFTTA